MSNLNEYMKRVDQLLNEMSLEEKVNQMSCRLFIGGMGSAEAKHIDCGTGEIGILGSGQSLTDLAQKITDIQQYVMEHSPHHIPALFHCEGVQGIVLSGTVQYPAAIAQGATFEPRLTEKMADEIRKDMKTLGLRHVLSPLFDVVRDFRWGRVNETYGGDPVLVAQMGSAFVRGVQGSDLSEGIAATAKHFLGYAYTEGGMNMTKVLADEYELREVFAMPFEAAIHEAEIATVMNAYSEINGRPVAASKAILTDLLRKDLGFDGIVVSDYSSLIKLVTRYHIAETAQEAGILALNAGIDLETPAPYGYVDCMIKAIEEGKVDISDIDRCVRRILLLKYRLGLFDHPYPDMHTVKQGLIDQERENTSLTIARKAMVLTKNDGLLPLLDKKTRLAVIGPCAHSLRHLYGSYSNVANKEMLLGQVIAMEGVSDTLNVEDRFSELTGIHLKDHQKLSMDRNATTALSLKFEDNEAVNGWLRKEYPGAKDIYTALNELYEDTIFAEGCGITDPDESGFAEAEKAAANADAVVLCLGGKNGWGLYCTSGEGVDRVNYGLMDVQEKLLKRIYEVNPNIVLVHVDCVPLVNSFAYSHVPAIIEAWLPGGSGGTAVAETISGKNNPGGRLPFDVPLETGIGPVCHYQHNGTGMGVLLPDVINPQGYVDVDANPVLPFGWGLSYTHFQYSDISLTRKQDNPNKFTMSITVKNTGELAGDDVVMLFGKDTVASMIRPRQVTIGFKRLSLQSGEQKTVDFTFDMNIMAMMNIDREWLVEKGEFRFFFGTDSMHHFEPISVILDKDIMVDPNKRCFYADVLLKE